MTWAERSVDVPWAVFVHIQVKLSQMSPPRILNDMTVEEYAGSVV